MSTWDVIVVGLGGVGSSAAYHLAERGLRVLGIDQFGPAHDRGSSHGETRAIRQAYFEHPSYVPLLRRSYHLWRNLEARVEESLLDCTGLVEMGPADGVVIPGVLQSAAEHQLSIEELTPEETHYRWPGLRMRPDWKAVLEREAGYLKVEACVAAHLRAAGEASAELRHGQAVLSWRCDGSGVQVVTEQSTERAGHLVLAGGPWSHLLLSDLGLPMKILRKHQYWFDSEDQRYDRSEGFPCFFHETDTGYFYGFPKLDPRGVKVARHSGGTPVKAPTESHSPDLEDQRLVAEYLKQYLPGVSEERQGWAGCYYSVTPDEHFIVDRHPDHEAVTLVAGLSGHGFKFTSVLGELAAELTCQGSTSLDTTLLRLEREMPGH